jgi:Fungal specific transcription factor domain
MRDLGYSCQDMLTTTHGSIHNLPRLNTNTISTEHAGGLRTAPVYGAFPNELDMSDFAFGPGNTINPNQLHMGGMQGFAIDDSSFQPSYSHASNLRMLQEGESLDWLAPGFERQRFFGQTNESAIEGSSPSVMDTNSPEEFSDTMLPCGTSVMSNLPVSASQLWNVPMGAEVQMMASPADLDFPSAAFNDMIPAPHGTISPKSLLALGGSSLEMNFPSPPPLNPMDHPLLPGFIPPGYYMPIERAGGASTASTASIDSGLLHSSITTVSTDLITEHTRSTVLTTLSHYNGLGQPPYSQPAANSSLSPNPDSGAANTSALDAFPSTSDLQRYLAAYVQCFHPHLPFLHIPSLNFEASEYSIPSRLINREPHFDHVSISGGGGCLMLAITAIGALYEHEMTPSKQLFEASKRMIAGFLEERQRVNLHGSGFGPIHQAEAETTPLWLVQAMLLNVIYGYNCGDKMSAEIASNHCATLVSLARSAELSRPYPGYMVMTNGTLNPDIQMNGAKSNGWNLYDSDDSDWQQWKIVEERKRTLYAVFILSSLLVSAYNHPPALTNSEIRLSLPCDEDLWNTGNAPTWRSMGGTSTGDNHHVMFNAALGHLLTASQRPRHQPKSSDAPFGLGIRLKHLPESELKPNSFGCLILINALHNYIWETRQRHLKRQWTIHDTDQMHGHIEPALRAWQAAWAANPTHSLERPNPFGAGPLSADCIPLLDLAYVRLFVSFGRSKEAFWQRDFETMADGLAQGVGVGHNSTHSPSSSYDGSNASASTHTSASRRGSTAESPSADGPQHKAWSHDEQHSNLDSMTLLQPEQLALRERNLRKAAFYAADSLAMSDKLGVSFAEQTSRELPLQSAICAFDCALVLAEWINTVQDRIGRYSGIIGSEEDGHSQAARLILLEEEDKNLLNKVRQVLHSAESKSMPGSVSGALDYLGYGSRILLTTASMLQRAAVWPGLYMLHDLSELMTDLIQ